MFCNAPGRKQCAHSLYEGRRHKLVAQVRETLKGGEEIMPQIKGEELGEVALKLTEMEVRKGRLQSAFFFNRKLNWMEQACCGKVADGRLSLDTLL